jgi:undecaprenyl-diphosphatase
VIDWLYSIDLAVFRLGNSTLVFPAGDWFFPFITDLHNFIIPYALSAIALMVFGKKKGIVTVLLLAVTIALSDQLSSFVVKPLVARIRPCHVLDDVRLLVGCGSGFSFTSSHATNNFAMAVLIGHFYTRARPYLLIWATLVAWSRVYVGVHYPSDLLGGALLGSAIALGVAYAYEFGVSAWHGRKNRRPAAFEDTKEERRHG